MLWKGPMNFHLFEAPQRAPVGALPFNGVGLEHLTRPQLRLKVAEMEKGVQETRNAHRAMTDLLACADNVFEPKMLQQSFPAYFERLFPRNIQSPPQYASPKIAVAPFFIADMMRVKMSDIQISPAQQELITRSNSMSDHSPAPVLGLGRILEQLQVPTYYVSETLMQAALQTDLPEDFDTGSLRWPLDGMLFMLPQGHGFNLAHPEAEPAEAATIALGRIPKDTSVASQSTGNEAFDSYPWRATCFTAKEDIVAVVATSRPKRQISMCWHGGDTGPMNEGSVGFCLGDADDLPHVDETAFAVAQLAFKLVLIMNASPVLVETGSLSRAEKVRKGVRVQSALWSPNFFGRRYRPRTAVESGEKGTGGKKRWHIRRGHIRKQPFGPGLVQFRDQWIEPMHINPPDAS